MNPITDALFTVTWFALFVFAIRSLIKGWSLMREVPAQGYSIEKKTECDLEEYRALQERIEELKSELEDPWEDDDEDGGLVVRK